MAVYLTRYRLPVSYSTEIGRIITRWAFLEWRMRETAYLLLDIGPKEGRLAVREPRATDYLTMLEDLIRLKSLKTKINFKELRKSLEATKSLRDGLAHGIWLKHGATKQPVLQIVSGSYPPTPGAQTVKARIDPQAVEIRLQSLKDITREIDNLTLLISLLKHSVGQQLSS